MASNDDKPKGNGNPPPLPEDVTDTLAVPPPPPAPKGSIQVALGLALMQASAFDRLPLEIQQTLLQLADQMDDRGYQYALRTLEQEAELQTKEIEDRGKGRKQILSVVSLLFGLALIASVAVVWRFIDAAQYSQAHTMMMSLLAAAGTLLGGAGLSTLLQKMFGQRD